MFLLNPLQVILSLKLLFVRHNLLTGLQVVSFFLGFSFFIAHKAAFQTP